MRTARDETIDALCRRFADDELSLAELERRLEKARSARTRQELRALIPEPRLAPAPPAPRPPAPDAMPRPRTRPARRPVDVPEAAADYRPSAPGTEPVRTSSHLAIAVMGGTKRAGRWVPPDSLAAVAIMGGVELDFRDAVLRPNTVVEINCFAFWGGIDITVPPDMHVDSRGFAFMGAFEQNAEIETDPPPGAPTIRINGFALMGGVDVKVKERIGRVRSGE
jgi:hypothetical protein